MWWVSRGVRTHLKMGLITASRRVFGLRAAVGLAFSSVGKLAVLISRFMSKYLTTFDETSTLHSTLHSPFTASLKLDRTLKSVLFTGIFYIECNTLP